MGVNTDTGIAGLTLGGGFGKLGRKYGLACDNLIAADVVTADGHLVRASAEENCDLFWGLRGGGGNFGIVTAFEYRLHPFGPLMAKASLAYDFKNARDAMRAYHAFARAAPDAICADAALARLPDAQPVFAFSLCHVGPREQAENDIERALKAIRPAAKPLDERITAAPYVEIQSASDSVLPPSRRYYWKAHFLREISDEAIDVLLDRYAAAPSLASLVVIQHVGGAIARVPSNATAYAQRDAVFDCFPAAIWDDPADDETNIRWARDLWAAMQPFSSGGVYVNNLGEEGEDRVKAAYRDNFPRLAALKRKYDPDNFFSLNQNIKPAA
jgi:FAD/FMN-containing dehydrogenase